MALAQLFTPEASRAAYESASPAAPAAGFRAIDGDTIESDVTGERIRLANIDTAETADRAECSAERRHGEHAKRRVREILRAAAVVRVDPVGRSDAYGRTIAYVAVDGRDLGGALMAEHLARPWRGRREPWCDGDGRLLP